MLPLTNPPPRPANLVGIAPPRLDHIFIMAEDVDGVTAFFRDVLEFRLTEQIIANDGHQLATWLERVAHPARHRDRHRPERRAAPLRLLAGRLERRPRGRRPAGLQRRDHRRRARPARRHPRLHASTSSTRSATATRSSPAATGSTRTSSRSPGPRRRWAGPCSTTTARSTSASSRCTLMTETASRSRSGLPPYGPHRRPVLPGQIHRTARAQAVRAVREPRRGGRRPAPLPAPVPGARRTARPRSAALLEVDGERFTREFAGATRDKEIVPPPERKAQEDFATEIRIIRHGITQGYSDRLRPDPDGRLAVAPARAQPVQERPARPEGPDRLRRHQPGPADRRPDLPRHARRAGAVGPRGRRRPSPSRSPSCATSRSGRRTGRATSPRRSASTRR